MPSEQLRPGLGGGNRSSSSIMSATSSPSSTPPQQASSKAYRSQKHAVGGGRIHARVPSSKGLHKHTRAHGEGSHTDLKKLAKGGSSSTNLNKNNSQVSLKRNRSSADIPNKPKSSQGQDKPAAAVHFEIGDQDDQWEEASSSAASPALSRSLHSSAKASANNSRPHSPLQSPLKTSTSVANGAAERQRARHTTDGKIIAERLLQRTPSHNTTKMSLATATPIVHSPESIMSKSHGSADTPKSKDATVSSRFVGGSGTPAENLPFVPHSLPQADEVKRTRSMGNLTRQGSQKEREDKEAEESALAPRSRKSSTSHAYAPPQQSRTQQKLWLQRASSNIEPQQLTPGAVISALQGIHGGLGGSSLVGAGYDGRDPRIKIQLERTGLEYLVVRRHQDPVGKALKRLEKLPGAEKKRRIPTQSGKKGGAGGGRSGLSQSLKERSKTSTVGTGRASFEGAGSHDGLDERGDGEGDEGVGALLRTLWEKNFDLSASAD